MNNICVVCINNGNNVKSIIEQFKKQTYENKQLIILDSTDTHTLPSFEQDVTYINPVLELNQKIELAKYDLTYLSNDVADITSKLTSEKQKNEIFNNLLIKLEKPRKQTKAQDDYKLKQTEITKTKSNITSVLLEIKNMEEIIKKKEAQIEELTSTIDILTMDLSRKQSFGIELNDCKTIIQNNNKSDFYTTMEEGIVYHSRHLDTIQKSLMKSVEGVVTYGNVLVYNSSLILRTSDSSKLIIALSGFTKEFFYNNTIDSSIQSYDVIHSTLAIVKVTNVSLLNTIWNVYSKTEIVYSHNTDGILRMFDFR